MDALAEYATPENGKRLGAVAGAGLIYKLLDMKIALGWDLKFAARALPVLHECNSKAFSEWTITDIWHEAVAKYGNKTSILFENRRMSFFDIERTATQMAHFLLSQGLKPGDCVSLDMENKPEFVCWWLAATRIGVKVGLLNYNVMKKGLIHCVKVSNAAAIICDEDTEKNVAEVQDELGCKIIYWNSKHPRYVKTDITLTYDDLLGYPATPIDSKYRKGIKFTDMFGYIYTSGTTGLPKAANIMHCKMMLMGATFAALGGVTEQDTIYTCLPIYHSAGGGIGVMAMIRSGATLVLSRKFSATRFWEEVSFNRCTVIQYIGELGRYLVNYAKEHPDVYKYPHCVRLAMGNGLRPDVWDDFQDGFRITDILEFYGSTEGNGALFNLCNRNNKDARGTIGRLGFLAKKIMGMVVVKFDVVEEEPIRNKEGRLMECAPGEKGELLMPIKANKPHTKFVGYTDDKSTNKKLLKNCFVDGDMYFRTGDLISRDAKGYYYFCDRIGDTFRWKGENVSTTEVAEVVSTFPGVVEANVYGVSVPGVKDGQGCCVALTLDKTKCNIEDAQVRNDLFELCAKNLPSYARPMFLRALADSGPSTGTFKQQKVELRKQGCNPSQCKPDVLYWQTGGKYEPLTEAMYAELEHGKAKL